MGTRSFLGYELSNKKIYAQYMQMDGGPRWKGRKFYIATLKGLESLIRGVEMKSPLPNGFMFDRIQHYLNNLQYMSGHSIGAHATYTQAEWGNRSNGEWQYLFTRKGDFIFGDASEDNSPVITIPWAITEALLHSGEYKNAEALDVMTWWESLEFKDLEENKKVLRWGKRVALHINEELKYDSSKLLRDELLKGNKPVLESPVFTIETGMVNAFPEQGENGYRTYTILTIGTTTHFTKVESMFADREGDRKNQATLQATIIFPKKKG